MRITREMLEQQCPKWTLTLDKKTLVECLSCYFDVRELVCPHLFEKFGDKSWQFLQTEQLRNILVVRVFLLKTPMTCNTWAERGNRSQSGYRCNVCEIAKTKTSQGVVYASAHCNGAGHDFLLKDMTAAQAREILERKQNMMPHAFRMEKDVNWLHLDCYDAGQHCYEFVG